MAKFDESLELKKKNSWSKMDDATVTDTFEICERYKAFLDCGKTEREVVDNTISILTSDGYTDFNDVISGKVKVTPGLKVYYNNRGRSLFIAILGKKEPEYGLKIVGSHIDAPRLDIKPTPLYESSEIAYLKTHYYGGVKKYQWVATPLALHGVIVKQNGEILKVAIGEDKNDPCFVISDLLPHLAREQMAKTVGAAITAEQLNLIIGSMPETKDTVADGEDGMSVKQQILTYLFEKYGITERDFMRAELQVVPAANAQDVGFDRAFIGAYGHDDRICAFTSLEAIRKIKEIPEHTAVCYFADKEEIGSVGNTGARSNALEYFIEELCAAYYTSKITFKKERCMQNCRLLSADVTAAYDPTFADVFDTNTVAYAGHGISIAKYTGHGGKSNASDASAEFVYEVTNGFDSEDICWQINEMGKVDAGGGGTIAQYMADRGMEVLDCGVALLSMHAPFELASKADIYWTYRAYKNFLTTK